MRIKSFYSIAGAFLVAALAVVGCSDYDNGYTEEQLNFIRDFKEVFGDIDHNQDWNLAEQGTVTVTTSQPTRVKIYANTFGTYKLVGDYENVSGTRTLTFDMVEGTTDIIVSNGQSAQKAKVGDAVTLAGTRYAFTGSESKKNSAGEDIITVKDSWREFSTDKYLNIVVEQHPTGKLPEGVNNLKEVTKDFKYVSQGPFTIYPIYINSSSSHILGIYWKDINGDYQTQYVYRDNCVMPTEEWTQYTPLDYAQQDHKDADGYKAKPITINLDAGVEFGFFLEVYQGSNGSFSKDESGYFAYANRDINNIQHCAYSEEELNQKYSGQPMDERSVNDKNQVKNDINESASWAGTFTTKVDNKEVIYLGFEDWGSVGGWDLNDLVFLMEGAPNLPIPVDNDATPWILSAEDLGGSFDIDYNDVVVEVSHVSGRNQAFVTPLAAGGTLASFIYFNNGTKDECLGEIHSFFGQGENTSGSYSPVNVGGKTPTTSANKVIAIDVADGWSISSFPIDKSQAANQTALNESQNNTMGGFYVKVLEQGEGYRQPDNDANVQIIQNKTVQGADDNVPYIICTPKTWERNNGDGTYTKGVYRWPQEHVAMFPFGEFAGAAYTGNGNPKYSFESWVKGEESETSIFWYKYPNVEMTCASSAPVDGTGSSGEGGGDGGDIPSIGNDYSKYGTPLSLSDYTETTTYDGQVTVTTIKNAILTDDIKGESCTLTYIVENANWINNVSLNGYEYGSWGDNDWWNQPAAIGSVVTPEKPDNENYYIIQFTIEKSQCTKYTYLSCDPNTDGTIHTKVYIK